MSTFNGVVSEFPDIQIDFFRQNPAVQPPLACFLSHVHGDHLAGLETLRSPFVYCSAATREILLRLERYPCRINYAKGILESRQQTYQHLARVLKPLPLETPTDIELHPGRQIQVTLFDANHCPGAVMFLIEDDEKAVLYTGDIRSEPWFVNSLFRNPSLVEYTSGLRTLDKIYLDTSFIDDTMFQTKSEGIAELLRKVSKYPKDTVFHIQAWTYGYEDVWIALSKALKSQIHVDDYKLGIYNSLKSRSSEGPSSKDVHLTPESPALTGYMCGNAPRPGCLTSNDKVRLHSCERGNMCELARKSSTVIIQPIIAHLPNGQDLAEVGIGGGGDDLQREAELDFLDQGSLDDLLQLSSGIAAKELEILSAALAQVVATGRNISLDQDLDSLQGKHSAQDVFLLLAKKLGKVSKSALADGPPEAALPKIVRFPFSRHSSYAELCHLVQTFRPKDIWPCTVNPTSWLRDGITIGSLFGRFCSGNVFVHDIAMQALAEKEAQGLPEVQHNSQTTIYSLDEPTSPGILARSNRLAVSDVEITSPGQLSHKDDRVGRNDETPLQDSQSCAVTHVATKSHQVSSHSAVRKTGIQTQNSTSSGNLDQRSTVSSRLQKRGFDLFEVNDEAQNMPSQAKGSFTSDIFEGHSSARRDAYLRMRAYMTTDDWAPISLISTSDEHTRPEAEL